MAKPKPPRISLDDLPDPATSEFERFKDRLYFRLLNSKKQIDEGNLNEAWVAFEALGATFPLLDEGCPHDDLADAFPFPNWREETVEVPRAALRAILTGWQEYVESEAKTLGQSFGFEHLNRQGKRPMREVSRKIDSQRKMANDVESRYRQLEGAEARSLEDVVAEVADLHSVSTRTVERAYSDHRGFIDENLRRSRERK